MRVWPGPIVREAALSQSSPTPQTQPPARVVASETEGAPDAAEPELTAPLAAVSAPMNAATVIAPW